MSTPIPWGSEFLVNTTTTNGQSVSTITALADGRFVIAWTDRSQTGGDTSESAVRAQLLTADGSKDGDEFLVNTTTTSVQSLPKVTALVDGRFVIAWEDASLSGEDSSGRAVRAQRFLPDGSRDGAEFLVNTTTAGFQIDPMITALADGRFIIVWVDESRTGGDTSSTAIRAQLFGADGSRDGAEFLVNTFTANGQDQPTITALVDGRFVIAWTSFSQNGGDTSESAVRAQLFGADGSRDGAEFLVNTTAIGGQQQPAITALADGRFVIAWEDGSQTGGDTSSTAIRAQLFGADGSRDGAEFLVNTTTTAPQSFPTITALVDGRFVIAWSDQSQTGGDTSFSAIRAQLFGADGSRDGNEFLVNTTTINFQFQPTITALADGRFVIAWRDGSQSGGDTSGEAVRARIFDPRSAAVNLIGTIDADDLVGTIFGDTIAGRRGNDRLHGGAGDDQLNGEEGRDVLEGEAGNDGLAGGLGNDILRGGLGSDQLLGNEGNDLLDGGFGSDVLDGGAGNDVQVVDSVGDLVVEAAGSAGGRDQVRSETLSLDLTLNRYANVENARLTGSSDRNLIGNAGANTLIGNEGANTLRGNAGTDKLTGNGGVDGFVLSSSTGFDTITDFLSGTDRLLIRQASLPIGNGDTVIDGAVTRNAPGGFASTSELVIFSADISGPITTAKAAAAIGSAEAGYAIGATRLFAVDNGSRSQLFRFTAANADALISASELTTLAVLSSTPALAVADVLFTV